MSCSRWSLARRSRLLLVLIAAAGRVHGGRLAHQRPDLRQGTARAKPRPVPWLPLPDKVPFGLNKPLFGWGKPPPKAEGPLRRALLLIPRKIWACLPHQLPSWWVAHGLTEDFLGRLVVAVYTWRLPGGHTAATHSVARPGKGVVGRLAQPCHRRPTAV